jgi:hypothetical protein
MILLAIWLVAASIVGWVASERGRSAISWALAALVISPLLAALLLVAVPATQKRVVSREERAALRVAIAFCAGVAILIGASVSFGMSGELATFFRVSTEVICDVLFAACAVGVLVIAMGARRVGLFCGRFVSRLR